MMTVEDRQPDAGDDFRPWEQPGAVRRDCEPHRGVELYVAGVVAIVICVITGPFIYTAPLGAIFGVVVWLTPRRDLAKMRAGRMDPAGLEKAKRARRLAIIGVGIAVGFPAGCVLLALTTRLIFGPR